jgi:D-tyrosyl-tRNA(Tyr) deacylase
MRAVVQRVSEAAVRVDDTVCGRIGAGLLVYLGVGDQDTPQDLDYLADKITHLRIFPDPRGKMNLSALDTGAEILVISQFTLYGDTRKGRRPSYSHAAAPEQAEQYYLDLVDKLRVRGFKVETGRFAALMDVVYTNHGPVTILMDSRRSF